RTGFEDPAGHGAPGPAGDVVDHQDRQTAHADAEPENVGDQIRTEELCWAEDTAERTKDHAYDSGYQRRSLDAIENVIGRQMDRGRRLRSATHGFLPISTARWPARRPGLRADSTARRVCRRRSP